MSDQLVTALALAAFGLVMGGVFFFLDLQQHLGLPFWRRWGIRGGGVRAQAKVLDSKWKGAMGGGGRVLELIVEVQGREPAPYRARVGEVFDIFRKDRAEVGMVLPVFVDPGQRETIVVDFASLDRDIKSKSQQEERLEEERRAKLMRGD
jgi:hypothetical protein